MRESALSLSPGGPQQSAPVSSPIVRSAHPPWVSCQQQGVCPGERQHEAAQHSPGTEGPGSSAACTYTCDLTLGQFVHSSGTVYSCEKWR